MGRITGKIGKFSTPKKGAKKEFSKGPGRATQAKGKKMIIPAETVMRKLGQVEKGVALKTKADPRASSKRSLNERAAIDSRSQKNLKARLSTPLAEAVLLESLRPDEFNPRPWVDIALQGHPFSSFKSYMASDTDDEFGSRETHIVAGVFGEVAYWQWAIERAVKGYLEIRKSGNQHARDVKEIGDIAFEAIKRIPRLPSLEAAFSITTSLDWNPRVRFLELALNSGLWEKPSITILPMSETLSRKMAIADVSKQAEKGKEAEAIIEAMKDLTPPAFPYEVEILAKDLIEEWEMDFVWEKYLPWWRIQPNIATY